MITRITSYLSLILLLMVGNAFADNMVMARVPMKADLTFEHLKDAIEGHGYSVAHVQLCDGGMKEFGYKSDLYRVVFFGKIEEVSHISEDHPEFVPYVPLKMTVVAERGETLLSIVNPQTYAVYYPNDKDMQIQFARWYNDILSILSDMQKITGEKVSMQFVN